MYDDVLERKVVSLCLRHKKALHVAYDIIIPPDFYGEETRAIYSALVSHYEQGDEIDYHVIRAEIKPEHVPVLDEVFTLDIGLDEAEEYCGIIADYSRRRTLTGALKDAVYQIEDLNTSLDEMVDSLSDELLDLMMRHKQDRTFEKAFNIYDGNFAQEVAERTVESAFGISTTLDFLNEITFGFRKGDYVIVAGLPGCLSGDTIVRVRSSNQISGREYRLADVYRKYHKIKRDRRRSERFCSFNSKGIQTLSLRSGIIDYNGIEDVVFSGHKETYNVLLDNGQNIRATLDHKFCTPDGFIELRHLAPGWKVFCKSEEKYREIVRIKHYGKEPTYDIMMESPYHNFVANDVVVHNSGKTSLLCQAVAKNAIDYGEPGLIFSIEAPKKTLLERMIANYSGISHRKIQTGSLTNRELDHLIRTAEKFKDAPIYINDSTPDARQIRSITKRMKAKVPNLSIVCIDYFQNILKHGTGEEAWGDISKTLNAMKKELDICVALISQLSREQSRREDRRPQLSDLKNTSQLEQDADVIMFLHRQFLLNQDAKRLEKEVELIIRKNRNGPCGTIRVLFEGETLHFIEAPKQS